MNSTAVLPTKYSMHDFDHSDPRFYAGKDMVLLMARKDNSCIPPQNAVIVPVLVRLEKVELLKTEPFQGIKRDERANKRGYVAGSL